MLRAYGDGKLFGEPYGDAPIRVVFLHGWARRALDFAECATELAGLGVGSVALDLPGFGASPLPMVAGGARYYAELVAPVLRQISDGPLVLVGHSNGGSIALVLAVEHPELVSALVVTGAPLLRSSLSAKSAWRYRVTRFLRARGLISEKSMEAARQRYGSADYRNASGLLRDILVATVNESYEDELARVRVPVTMVWGELDREVPVSVANRASALLHTAHSFHSVADVGHLLPTQAPHDLALVTLAALA